MSKSLIALGVMNGTSLDGVDAVLSKVTLSKRGFVQQEQLQSRSFSFPKSLRSELKSLAQGVGGPSDVSEAHFRLGEFYAKSVGGVRWRLRPDVIGLHGQTIFHRGRSSTLQIGEPSFLALKLKCPVACQFRNADVALGGEGAPFAPLFHELVLARGNFEVPMGVLNLGGISNLTLLSKKTKIAFDIGPANIVSDGFLQAKTKFSFDENGDRAKRGIPDMRLVDSLMAQYKKYFDRKPPKSTGRELFSFELLNAKNHRALKSLSVESALSTLNEWTAYSVFQSVDRAVNERAFQDLSVIYSCGGGALNGHLVSRIRAYLQSLGIEFHSTESLGWSPMSVEGACFGLLAALRFWEVPVSLSAYTGAKSQKVVLGSLIRP